MTTTALDAPFLFAIAALDLCGAQIDQIPGEAIPRPSEGDFRLRFDLTNRIELKLEHESDSQTYRVGVLLAPSPAFASDVERLALQLNSFHEGTRRYVLDGQTQAIVLTESFSLKPDLDVEAFALSIADMIQSIDALKNYQESLSTKSPASDLLESLSRRA
jgi:hypothetical protein